MRDTRIPANPGVTAGGGLWVVGGRRWMVGLAIERGKRETDRQQETDTLPWLGLNMCGRDQS